MANELLAQTLTGGTGGAIGPGNQMWEYQQANGLDPWNQPYGPPLVQGATPRLMDRNNIPQGLASIPSWVTISGVGSDSAGSTGEGTGAGSSSGTGAGGPGGVGDGGDAGTGTGVTYARGGRIGLGNPRYPMKPYQAARVASQFGRQGDDTLVHMKRSEVGDLAKLNGGKLPINPQTGLPEAFGLGGVLGILGSVAGLIAAPFTGGSSLLLSAAGAGLGSTAGSLLEGKDLGSSLTGGLLSGLMGYGIGGALGSLGEAGISEAAKEMAQNGVTAATTAAPAASGIGSIAEAGVPAAGAGYGPIADLTAGAGVGTGAGQLGPEWTEAISKQAINAYSPQPSIMDPATGFNQVQPMQAVNNQMSNIGRGLRSPGALWDTFGNNAMKTTVPIAAGLYGQSLSDQPQQGGAFGEPMHNYPTLPGPNKRRYSPQPAGYDNSQGKEWNYWTPAYAGGGEVEFAPRAEGPWARDIGARARLGATGDFYNLLPEDRQRQLAEINLESLGPVENLIGGIAHGDSFGDIAKGVVLGPLQGVGRALGLASGGEVDRAIRQANRQGQHHFNPDMIDPEVMDRIENRMGTPWYNERFIEEDDVKKDKYGREIPRDIRFAMGGPISGPGGGLDDAIPAVIDGRQKATLSSGEYVVPAQAVSGLGNGSTEEGVRQLDNMVGNVMMAKFGTPNPKAKPINAKRMMPRSQMRGMA